MGWSPEAGAHFARFSLKVNILLRGTTLHSLSVQSPRDELQCNVRASCSKCLRQRGQAYHSYKGTPHSTI